MLAILILLLSLKDLPTLFGGLDDCIFNVGIINNRYYSYYVNHIFISNALAFERSQMRYKVTYKRLLKHKTERMWIQENTDINVLNYWFYRYFTNRYLNWLRERAIDDA